MPYLDDGTPVDLVLNPLGVPSRMNLGQILETHLGWAARTLGVQLAEKAASNGNSDDASLRSFLDEVYGGEATELLSNLKDEDVVSLARRASRGIHTASPVFDGASEEEIFDLGGRAGLPKNGQARLVDGRTGETFIHDVTVGIMYLSQASPLGG